MNRKFSSWFNFSDQKVGSQWEATLISIVLFVDETVGPITVMAADSITGDYRTTLRNKMTTTVKVKGSKPKTSQSGHPVAEIIGCPGKTSEQNILQSTT